MNELILITSYTSNSKKEQLLRDLVNDVTGKGYDVMISTHIFTPKDIFEKVDYVICENENRLLTDIKNKQTMVFYCDEFTICSTETYKNNHGFAMIKLLVNGLSYSKKMGYEKVHFIEYDTRVESFDEIIENSEILNTNSTVYYTTEDFALPTTFISFNLNTISKNWFEISNEKIMNFFNEESTKLAEEYELRLINEGDLPLKKDKSILEKNKIYVGLHNEIRINSWMIPTCIPETQEILFFGWNTGHHGVLDVQVIINKNNIFHVKIEPGFWSINNIGNIKDINTLLVLLNNETFNFWDFSIIDCDYFIKKNYIKYT
jgi:hypothetical protein